MRIDAELESGNAEIVNAAPGAAAVLRIRPDPVMGFLQWFHFRVHHDAPDAAEIQPRGGRETIRLAEDDQAVRVSTRSTLERHGYRVLEAANAAEAIKLWPIHRAEVSLLLTDLVMPGGTTGQQLAEQLRSDNPRLEVIFTSGYSAEIAGRELKSTVPATFVQKPFVPDELLRAVRGRLDLVSM